MKPLKRPELQDHYSTAPNTHHFELLVDEDIEYFKGHFDNHSILPGVVQLDWALHYFNLYIESSLYFAGSDVIKYQLPILPNERVCLSLTWKPNLSKFEFKFESDKGIHSSGKIKVQSK